MEIFTLCKLVYLQVIVYKIYRLVSMKLINAAFNYIKN